MCVHFLTLEMATRRESHIPVFGGAYAKLAAAFMTPLSVVRSQAVFSLFHISLPFEPNDHVIEIRKSIAVYRSRRCTVFPLNLLILKNVYHFVKKYGVGVKGDAGK